MRPRFLCPLALILFTLCFGSTAAVAADDKASPGFSAPDQISGDAEVGQRAVDLVAAFYRLDLETLKAALTDDFRYIERAMGQDLDRDGFLALVPTEGTDYEDRSMDIEWVGVIPSEGSDGSVKVDLRGKWQATKVSSKSEKPARRLDMAFSIQLEMKGGKIERWTQIFKRGWLPLPVHGDGRYQSEHFNIHYLSAEFDEKRAARLEETMEIWYRRTADYLDREFEGGRRVLVDVAGPHKIPVASAPGPDAFFLVSAGMASLDYGFSLVHELTHNLMGLSAFSQKLAKDLPEGNRLFDEGFGVYVEEKLAESGQVFPNFGVETHRAYLDLKRELNAPSTPILEAERLRMLGNGEERRLGYLQEASFVKWLIDFAGVKPSADAAEVVEDEPGAALERFKKFFGQGIDVMSSLYGRDLAQLEKEWLAFLERENG